MSRMSELDYDRQTIEAVRKEMDQGDTDVASPTSGHPSDEPGSPEQMMEERVARLVDQMIDLAMLALDPEQKPLVEREWRGISQILLRAKLMLSIFNNEDIEPIRRLIVGLETYQKPALKVVRNHG